MKMITLCWILLLLLFVGDSDQRCTDNCSTERKHTDTISNVVRQIAYIHGRESILFRDKERIQHKEEDHIHSTPISHCCIGQQGCWWQPFSFFLFSSLYMSHNSHFALSNLVSIYRQGWWLLAPAHLQKRWLHMGWYICQWWVQSPLTNGNPIN